MTNQLTPSQRILLEIMSDGLCHSGNDLGQILGISRQAVWKQINLLTELGLPITSIPNKGYLLLHGFTLLNEQEISQKLSSKNISTAYKLHLFTSIDSTNRYLKELPSSALVDICCAELQTQGRGRFGRHWHSPFGENIYCSSRWNLCGDLSKLSGLSLVTSLAIRAALDEFHSSTDIKIKWPNDILWQDKKLCGSLIEVIAESNGTAQVIIGIGLNVNSDTKNHPLPDKPWCSLYELSDKRYNRNELIACLITHLHRYIIQFINNDLGLFMSEWSEHDYLEGKQITVTQGQGALSGIARGINNSGQLILRDNKEEEHLLSSGDTSLHSKGVRPE